MTETQRAGVATFPQKTVDLLLIHAPAFFDFRDREDIYFPYLSTSGDVPITPLYEYFPVGFKTIQRYLSDRGFEVAILNLSTVLLKFPNLDIKSLLRSVNAKLIGIDLHWMVHVQGSLEVAKLVKELHPQTPVVFGGISSTFYASQLVQYPFIDMVLKGYDTHAPLHRLLTELSGSRDLSTVENLTWKRDGEIVDNGITYLPDTFSCGIDWTTIPREKGAGILELLSTQNAGCAYNCGWCGGSREAFRRVFKRQRAMARKPLPEIAYEFQQARLLPGIEKYYFYSVGSYNEPRDRFDFFLDQVAQTRLKSISYEQFHLTPDDVLRKMAQANPRTFITLSPESHDMRVAKLAGRGVYTPEAMEAWIERALNLGIYSVDVWYFIGMPEQDEASVLRTVDYCETLLRRFKGQRVTPLLCPMIPFLDPASTFFEHPEEHGYTVFYRTVEEHRRGMERASLVNRTNYETRWLRREQLVEVGYKAVRSLAQLKAEYSFLPRSVVKTVVGKIDDALDFGRAVYAADCLADPQDRARELARLGPDIRRRNHEVFFSGVANQAFPINREIGGRWFDETLHGTLAFEETSLPAS
jgi:clorobiocin/coumermycin A biosynthesis protein CloN6/CouN6